MVDLDILITGAQAAKYFGLSRQMIRKWRLLGHIKPAPSSSPSRPLYRLGDLRDAERRTRQSAKSSRNPQRQQCSA